MHNNLNLVCEYHNFRIYKDNIKKCYCIGTSFKIIYSYFTSVEDAKNFINDIYKQPIKYIEDLLK